MVGNPYRWRAAIPQLEHRNATAGNTVTHRGVRSASVEGV